MMSKLRSTVEVTEWYLRRPRMWGEFGRDVGRRVRPPASERSAGLDRCRALSVQREEAFVRLGIPLSDVNASDEYRAARDRLAAKGVGMAGAADTAFLYAACTALGVHSVLETGVAHGLSSLAILLSLRDSGTGHLTSVDMPYRGSTNETYVGQAVPSELRSRWTLIRLPDRSGIPRAIRRHGPFDVVHYDSDKTRQGRSFAYPRLWEATRPGGLFVSDDIDVNLGFIEFSEQVGIEPIIWEKPGGDAFVGAMFRPSE